MKVSLTMEDLLSVDPARFWARVDTAGECWLWQGSVRDSGYGVCYVPARRTTTSAHRVAVALDGRDIPDGYDVDHLCRTRQCVRPDHLEPVTPQENTIRSIGDYCARGHELKSHGRGCRTSVVEQPVAGLGDGREHGPHDEANTYLNPSCGKRQRIPMEDELARDGICIRCEVRVNDGGRHRYCGSCRNKKARERK